VTKSGHVADEGSQQKLGISLVPKCLGVDKAVCVGSQHSERTLEETAAARCLCWRDADDQGHQYGAGEWDGYRISSVVDGHQSVCVFSMGNWQGSWWLVPHHEVREIVKVCKVSSLGEASASSCGFVPFSKTGPPTSYDGRHTS
jgi:hypothetical protein